MTDVTTLPPVEVRAVEHILGWPGFTEHADRLAHFYREGRYDFDAILADWLWSGGEHVALRAAQSLQDDRDFPRHSLLVRLDYDLLLRVLEAQRIACGRPARSTAHTLPEATR